MKSFLNSYDLNEKTVVLFNRNAGYGLGDSIETLKKLTSKSKVLDAFETKGDVERDGILFVMEGKKELQVKSEVREWLPRIKVTR